MATGGGHMISQRPLCLTEIAQEPHTYLTPIAGYEKMPVVSLEKAVEVLIDFLPDIQFYVCVTKQNYRNSSDGLTKDESASIMLYTMSWEPRDKCLYYVLNATLRSSNRQKLKPWFLYLRLLLNGLFRLPPISDTIYRGIKFDMSKEYTQGKTIVWWGFSSCTGTLSVLQSEEFLGTTNTRTMFMIKCDSGRDIRNHSFFPSEKEVLLLPATQFQVTGCLHQNDLHIIELEETQPSEPLLKPVPFVPIFNNIFLSTWKTSESKTKHGGSDIMTPKEKTKPSAIKPPVASSEYQNSVLEERIADNRYCAELDLKSMELTDQDMKIIAFDAIRTTTMMTILNLENNKIGPQGIQYLNDQLKYNKTIITLNLRCNQIGDKGTHYLSTELRQNTRLTTLDLGKNQIAEKGGQYLSKALRENSTLVELNLSFNRLGALGVEHLCDALEQNFTLRTLNLSFNDIGDQGSQYIRDALRKNTTLTTLDLEHNQIKAQGIQYLSDALQSNTTLIRLYLPDNRFGEKGIQYLNELKKKNKRLKISYQ